jgi:hypothetical protein
MKSPSWVSTYSNWGHITCGVVKLGIQLGCTNCRDDDGSDGDSGGEEPSEKKGKADADGPNDSIQAHDDPMDAEVHTLVCRLM